jgi:hypothetical protein
MEECSDSNNHSPKATTIFWAYQEHPQRQINSLQLSTSETLGQ